MACKIVSVTVRALREHKVELISFAEPLTKDASRDFFRKVIGIVNELQSAETTRNHSVYGDRAGLPP